MSDLISTLRSKKTGVETEPPAEKKLGFVDRLRKKLEQGIKSKLDIPVGATERQLKMLDDIEDSRPAGAAAVRG